MHSKQRILWGVTGAILAAIAEPAGAQDSPPAAAVYVEDAAMTEQRLAAIFTGRLVAIDRVDLVARVDGFLVSRGFVEGGDVKAGDVLYEIERAAYAASLTQIEGQIEAMEAQKVAAVADVDRKRELAARDDVAQSQLDISEATLGEIEGNIKALQGQKASAELQLSYTQVVAPFDGVTGLSAVDVGEYVNPGIGPLTTITRLDPIHVEFALPTAELLRYRAAIAESGEAQGTEAVDVFLDLPDGTRYGETGKINFVDTAVTQGTDTVLVRAEFPNPDRLLYHGELVEVRVQEKTAGSALTVPLQAVLRDLVGAYVMVVDDANTAQRVNVATGAVTDGRIVILDGLSEGDTVITEGLNKVQPGAVVDGATREPASN